MIALHEERNEFTYKDESYVYQVFRKIIRIELIYAQG